MSEERVKELLEHLTNWEKSPVYMHFLKWKANMLLEKFANDAPDVGNMLEWEFGKLTHNKTSKHTAIAVLVKGLVHKKWQVRRNAACVLGTSRVNGINVSVAVPALMNALVDENAEVREQAARALIIVGPKKGSYAALKTLFCAAREAKKRKTAMNGFARVSSAWSKELSKQAKRIIDDKRFHVPRIGKLGKTGRVVRVQRVSA